MRRYGTQFSVHKSTNLIITSSASRKLTVMEENGFSGDKETSHEMTNKNRIVYYHGFINFLNDASKPGFVTASP